MANIMQSMMVRNKPSRSPFDMSENVAFSACLGAYLPVRHMHLNPGDKIEDVLKFFSRTSPVRSAAYGRIRETFDFFFVPYRLLWRNYDSFFTDGTAVLTDFNNNESSYYVDVKNCPYFTPSAAASVINDVYESSLPYLKMLETETTQSLNNSNIGLSFYGPTRAQDMRRLLQYLGYGKVIDFGHDSNYENQSVNLAEDGLRDNIPLNALPLFAYHKIYYDFYRNSQWENQQTHMWYFHCDDGSQQVNCETPDNNYIISPHIFDLHFCNYEKDKYLGVLPAAELGSPAVVDIKPDFHDGLRALGVDSDGDFKLLSGGTVASPTSTYSDLALQFQVLALRQASALQKWKEISQFFPMNYKAQISAHYGFNIDEGRSNLVQYLGGTSNLVDINPILNNNLAAEGSEANIQGKGDNAGTCKIDFTAPEHGIFMCIYHANPLVDYNGDFTMIPETRKYFQSDFPIPEFDSIGLQQVDSMDMDIRKGNSFVTGDNTILGYAPRYIDYKSRVDRVLGDFTLSRKSWVLPLPNRVVKGFEVYSVPDDEHPGTISYRVYVKGQYTRFKVSPYDADSIFFLSPRSDYNNYQSDYFLVDASFACTKYSNLSRSGMPY